MAVSFLLALSPVPIPSGDRTHLEGHVDFGRLSLQLRLIKMLQHVAQGHKLLNTLTAFLNVCHGFLTAFLAS